MTLLCRCRPPCRVLLGVLVVLAGRTAAADDPLAGQTGPAHRSAVAADDPPAAVRTASIHETPADHPLQPAIRLARKSLAEMETIADYEATLVKQERLDGTLVEQTMQIRLRESPFSVYLRFGGAAAGREVLFVQGRNNNQLQVHEGNGLKSLVGTVSLATDGVEAMQENRYPITMIGMRRMLETVLTQWEEETKYGEIDVKFYPDARLGDRSCQVIEAIHPQPRRQFRFHITRLFIDTQSRLPVRVEQYRFPMMPGQQPPLEELYSYSDIRTNVGLDEADFSTANPDYNF